MRCPKCDSPMPIGGKVCKNCNFNAYTNQYESAPAKPVQPVRQPAAQQPARQTPVQQPTAPRAVPQRPAVNPTPVPKPVQQAAPAQKPQQSTVKPQKKKDNGFKRLISGALTLVLTVTAGYVAKNLTYNMVTGHKNKQSVTSQQVAAAPTERTINPAYTALLEKHGVTYTEKTSSMESTCLAYEEDGVLYILELGYWQDVVNEEVDTFYYPLSVYDENLLKSNIDASIDSHLNLRNHMDVSYSRIGDQYLMVQMHIDNMNHRDVIETLFLSGYLQVDTETFQVPDKISLEATVNEHLANGYIQK